MLGPEHVKVISFVERLFMVTSLGRSCPVRYGRPIAGVVNICKIDTTKWEDTVDTLFVCFFVPCKIVRSFVSGYMKSVIFCS